MNLPETSPEQAFPPEAPENDVRQDGDASSTVKPRWSRRAFLGGALGGAAAIAAAACGGSDPTPTPTVSPLNTLSPLNTPAPRPTFGSMPGVLPEGAYKNYLPYVSQGNVFDPFGEVMPPLEPTLTPTPSKTATPEATATDKPTSTPRPPTPTPTPPATPFPPGPPSKLGLFVGHNDPQIFDLLASKAITVIKTLELDSNFLAQIKQVSPNTRIVARIDLPQVSLNSFDPLAAAQAFFDQAIVIADDAGRRPYIDGWEAYNEPVASNADEMARLATFEAERTRLLGERGIRSVIGNFGTGQPPLELWPSFFPALQAAQQYDGWLGLHEYSAPTIYHLSSVENMGRYPGVTPADTGWLTLRYRKVYRDILIPAGLQLPLVMTELGVDGLVQNRPGPPDARGWQEFQSFWAENGYGLWGPGAYIEQLAWYDAAMRQDDYVLGGCIYAMAPTAGWETYDIRGPAASVLGQYLNVHAPA